MNSLKSYSLYPLSRLLSDLFPNEFSKALRKILKPIDKLNFIDVILEETNSGIELFTKIVIPKDFNFKFKIFGENESMVSLSNDTLIVYGSLSSSIVKLKIKTTIKLQIPPSLLKPISTSVDKEVILEFPIDFILKWNTTTNFIFEVETLEGFTLNEAMLGNTGFIISVEDLRFNIFEDLPPKEYEFSLTQASIIPPQFLLPKKEDIDSTRIVLPTLSLFDTTINSNGFSGVVSAYWDLQYVKEEENSETKPFYYYNIDREKSIEEQPLANFLGISGGFEYISLTFVNNELVDSKIIGKLLIPYFDKPVEIELNIITGNDKLDFTITLKSENQEGIELKKDELIALYMKSLSISKEGNSVALTVNGGLHPLLWNTDGLEWPRLDVEGLGIEQDFTLIDGKLQAPKMKFKEAWVDLKELATLDLFGFHFELNKIGMGYIEVKEAGKSDKIWLEFTGSLKLIEQLPMGVAVEGFRLTWDSELDFKNLSMTQLIEKANTIKVKFDGIHISHSIPNTIEFEGFIKFIKEAQNVGFTGGMDLRIPSTGLAVEANLLIGMNFQEPAYPYLYVQFGIELPSGIPLAQSGLALKGAKGMLGMNVEPALKPIDNSEQNPYYAWYKSTPEGITSASKWRDKRMSFAFGAGVTITTIDGKAFGVQGLLALVVPGPIIMLEGKALIFDGIFPKNGAPKAIAFFNGKDETVQFNIETSMQFGGGVVDVNAGIEAFFDFKNSSNWHLYIGKDEPKERRIHANILNIPNVGWLFEGNCYLMLDMLNDNSVRSRMGMKIGFEPPLKDLKVASIAMKAVIDGSGELTTNPFQFNGKVQLDAVLNINAFDELLTTSINASAEVEIEGVAPLIVDASIHCMVDLPVPDLEGIPVIVDMLSWFEKEVAELPDIPSYIEFDVPFHWKYNEVPIVSPLIQKVSMESNYVIGGGTLNPANDYKDSLIVPLDAKPTIMFDQDMNNSEKVQLGGFLDEGTHSFSAGKVTLKPSIKEIKLYKVDKKDVTNNVSINWGSPIKTLTSQDTKKQLWGMFRPEPMTENSTSESRKLLQLWSSNPFEFVNKMIPMALGEVEPVSYTNTVVNNTIFSSSKLDITTHCVHFNNKSKIEVVRVDDAYYQQLVIDDVVFQGSNMKIKDNNLICNSSILHVRFPERVSSFIMNFQSIEFSNIEFGNIEFYRHTKGEFIYEKDKNGNPIEVYNKATFCSNKIRTQRELSQLSVSHSNTNIQIKSKDDFIGFDCMDILLKSNDKKIEISLENICYITKKEKNKIQHWKNLDKVNMSIINKHENNLLSFDSYYKLEVQYNIKTLPNDRTMQFNYKDNITNEIDSSEIRYFQTEGPPKNIRPYIKWISPSHEYKTFFYEDDITIRFNRSYIKQFYPDNTAYALKVVISDSNENVITSYIQKWKKSASASLLMQEQEWYNFAEISFNELPKDDILELIRPNIIKTNKVINFNDWRRLLLSDDIEDIPTWNTNHQRLSINNKKNISSLYLSTDIELNNYIFKFETQLISNTKDSIVGAVIEFESIDNFYYLQVIKQPRRRVLLKFFQVKNGKIRKLIERVEKIPFTGGADKLARFSIYVDKVVVKIFYNEKQVMNIVNEIKVNSKTKVGFYSHNSRASFSEIGINELFLTLEPKSKYNLQIKMNEQELYKSTFMTSSFSSYQDLISSYSGTVNKLISTDELNLETLEASQKEMAIQKQTYYEQTMLYKAKAVNRAILEASKQAMLSATATHNEYFLDLLRSMDNIAYEVLPKIFTIYQVKKDNKTLGILLRSPETLKPQILFQKQQIGRTSFSLNKVSKTSWISNGDGTIVFIYSNINLVPSDTYKLTFTYVRDFEDDKEKINHLFDRAYESMRKSRNNEVIQISFKLD